jgi:hypothetical protein
MSKRASARAVEADRAASRYAFWLGLASAFGWALALGAVVWGLRAMERYVHAAQPPVECRLEWVKPPDFLHTPWLRADLEEKAGLRPEDDIHDPNLCAWVGTGLLQSAWIAKLNSVTKQADGTVRVDAVFREPVAYVQCDTRAYLIDASAVRLPAEYPANDPNLMGIFFGITGATAPLPPEGEVWTGEDLAKGLKLVQFLRQEAAQNRLPFRSSLGPVDVSNYYLKDRFDSQLRIRTVYPGCYIDWGLAPGEESEVDSASPSRKLDMLNTLYREQGRLPERIIVVRWADKVEYREPRKR